MADEVMTGGGTTPRPDPTVLTSALVDRAVANLKETLNARLDGMQRLLDLAHIDMRERPHVIATEITHLQALLNEKFTAVDIRIQERDEKVKEAKADAKVGIDAALASAEKLVGQSNVSFKEAVEKSEKSTAALLSKQEDSQKTSSLALGDKIRSVEARIDRIEGAAVGTITAKTEITTAHSTSNQNYTVLFGFIGAVAIIIALIERLAR